MKKTIIVLIIVIAMIAIVYHRDARADELICPPASSLVKNPKAGNWFAQTRQGLWKSYGSSFATRVTQFTGAQWVGENVGQITCVYRSEQVFQAQGSTEIQPTLPVLLVFHTLTYQPKSGKWQYVKNGVFNCVSTRKSDCPFEMRIKKKNTESIFEQAESLKEKEESTLQPDNN